MIEVVMSVCGDDQYFEMSKISIPSFLRSNPTAKLHIFTDRPKEIEPTYKCEVYDFNEAVKNIDKPTRYAMELKMADFDNNGVFHSHANVALLPLLAERVCSSDAILKIDVDSFFVGDICNAVEGLLRAINVDLILVERTRGDVMVPYGGLPGVGFLMWERGGRFVPGYTHFFTGNEQETILALYAEGVLSSGTISEFNYHICYPFKRAEQLGTRLTKKIIDKWIPFYIHVCGPGQIEKLKKLENWYGKL
jgi:hypothetical protein